MLSNPMEKAGFEAGRSGMRNQSDSLLLCFRLLCMSLGSLLKGER